MAFLSSTLTLRDKHERDGEWTHALNKSPLKLTHWSKAYMQAGRYGISFALPNGKSRTVKAGAGDAAVVGEFGKTLLAIVRDGLCRDIRAINVADGLSTRSIGVRLDVAMATRSERRRPYEHHPPTENSSTA